MRENEESGEERDEKCVSLRVKRSSVTWVTRAKKLCRGRCKTWSRTMTKGLTRRIERNLPNEQAKK
jgi:hypothetical protein